ncbi:hypothetical protein Syun_021879 [Stephania yunnanensis]|uniref:Uncharacterized protein n=1 Tax=Stephania yunnanensis TaxID=152371 RepID=A0AAP0IID2_9MAGN
MGDLKEKNDVVKGGLRGLLMVAGICIVLLGLLYMMFAMLNGLSNREHINDDQYYNIIKNLVDYYMLALTFLLIDLLIWIVFDDLGMKIGEDHRPKISIYHQVISGLLILYMLLVIICYILYVRAT